MCAQTVVVTTFSVVCLHECTCSWQTLNESVTSVCGGVVGSSQHDEVIVATYSGCVLGLTKEQLANQTISKEAQSKLATLKFVITYNLCMHSTAQFT